MQRSDKDIELQDIKKKKRKQDIANNQIATAAVHWADGVALTTIYSMFLKESLQLLLEQTAKYVLFPIAAAASIFNAILTWRHAHLERNKHDEMKNRNLLSAGVETASAVAITVAVVGSLVATSIFAVATPIIFTATIGAKALMNGGRAAYNGYKAATIEKKPHETVEKFNIRKDKYKTRAIEHAKGAVIGAITTVATACVFVFGKMALAGIGVFAGAVITGLAVMAGVKTYAVKKEAEEEKVKKSHPINDKSDVDTMDQTKQLSQGAKLAKGLGGNSQSLAEARIRRAFSYTEDKVPLLTSESKWKPSNAIDIRQDETSVNQTINPVCATW